MTSTFRPASRPLAILLVLASLAAACGDDGPADGSTGTKESTGVDRNKVLPSMTDSDRASLCDFVAAQYGGYGEGKSTECEDGSKIRGTAGESKELCVENQSRYRPNCEATIADVEECTKVQATDPCNAAKNEFCQNLIACAQAF